MKTLAQIVAVIFILLPVLNNLSHAQRTTPNNDNIIRLISNAVDETNQFEVTPLTPTLPGAYYSHLWWSGDNSFSFAAQPKHNHHNSTGNTVFPHVKMTDITTENYGNGGPPPLTFDFTTLTVDDPTPITGLLSGNNHVYVQNYRNAVIRDTMYLIVTYGNYNSVNVTGDIIINVGEHAEIIDDILDLNEHYYLPNMEEWDSGSMTISFQDLSAFEERSILIPVVINDNEEDSLEMVIELRRAGWEIQNIEGVDFFHISPKVAYSHDPNQMIEHSNARNQCDYRGGKIHYTVKFQNEGEGKTCYVRVECHLDDKVDLSSITGIKVPDCFDSCARGPIYKRYNSSGGFCSFWSIDSSTRVLTIEMNNLVLFNINDANLPCLDRARGQIEFDILVKDDYLFGPPVLAYSKIFFDKNEPIITNIAVTGCLAPVPLDQGGGFQSLEDSVICKYKWYILGGLLGLILILLILLARKKKRREETTK